MVVMFYIFFTGQFIQKCKEKYYKTNTAGSKEGKPFPLFEYSMVLKHYVIMKIICKRMTIDQLLFPSTHPIQVLGPFKIHKEWGKKRKP